MSVNKFKQTPDIRFSEFTEKWSQKQLKDCSEKVWIGLVTTMTTNYGKEGVLLIRNQNIRQNKIVDENPIYLNSDFANNYKYRALKYGDVVTVHTGDVGTSSVINEKYDGSQGFATLNTRVNNSILNNKFLTHFFNSRKYKIWALRYSTGDGRNNLNLNDFVKSVIPIPTLKEQQKIASFLSSIDDWIENLTQQKLALEKYKKGMMQKIFSQEIRFKDEDGNNYPEWNVISLQECLDYEQPTPYIVTSPDYDDSYSIPVLTAGKSFILGYTNESKGIYENNLPVIIFDDFTTTSQFVDFPFKVKSSAMKILKAKNNYDISFIYEMMKRIRYEISGHGRHWISNYSKIKVTIPSLAEQKKISILASSMDSIIKSKQQQINKAEQWKKGLMQKLFI